MKGEGAERGGDNKTNSSTGSDNLGSMKKSYNWMEEERGVKIKSCKTAESQVLYKTRKFAFEEEEETQS